MTRFSFFFHTYYDNNIIEKETRPTSFYYNNNQRAQFTTIEIIHTIYMSYQILQKSTDTRKIILTDIICFKMCVTFSREYYTII